MKILHTADWHLNDRLGRIDRTDDLRRAVERVARLCETDAIDVLIVAGDLFSELARPDALRETIEHWQKVFTGFLDSGGTILTVTGNHDNENFCRTLHHAMTLAAPAIGRPGEILPPGRLYLAAEPTFLRLADRQHGGEVQFVLMPFPTPSRYLRGDPGKRYASLDEKNRLLTKAFAQELADITSDSRYVAAIPSVLVAHVSLFGSHMGTSLFRLDPQEDLVVVDDTLHERFTYVALGHIHKAQAIEGHTHVRYSGPIERLDLGEQNYSVGVVEVEIGPKGLVGEPATIPLAATPIYEITIENPEVDLPRLRSEYEGATEDLVNLHIHYTAGEQSLEELLKELELLFPRWYARDWKERSALGPSIAPDLGEDGTPKFAETVREYLAAELQNHSDGERDLLLALAEELLREESHL